MTDQSFQSFLRQYMQTHGLGEAAIGHLAGVTVPGVRKWLKGEGPAQVHRARIQQELQQGGYRLGLLAAAQGPLGLEDTPEARVATLGWIQTTPSPDLWRQLHALHAVHRRPGKVLIAPQRPRRSRARPGPGRPPHPRRQPLR